MADPTMYRERNEAAELGIKDPIDSLRKFILQFKIADAGTIKGIDAEVAAQVEEAVEYAESSPAPDMSALDTNVYA